MPHESSVDDSKSDQLTEDISESLQNGNHSKDTNKPHSGGLSDSIKGKQKAVEILHHQVTPEMKNYGRKGEVDMPRDGQDGQKGHSPQQFNFNDKIDQPGDSHDFNDNDDENDNGKDNGKGKTTDDIDIDDDINANDNVNDVDNINKNNKDNEDNEDNVKESGEGLSINKSKPGHFSKAVLQEIEIFGKRYHSEAEQLAAKYGKNISQVIMKTGLSIHSARAANMYNDFCSWYALKFRPELQGCKYFPYHNLGIDINYQGTSIFQEAKCKSQG